MALSEAFQERRAVELKLLARAYHDPASLDKALRPPAQVASPSAKPAEGALRFD